MKIILNTFYLSVLLLFASCSNISDEIPGTYILKTYWLNTSLGFSSEVFFADQQTFWEQLDLNPDTTFVDTFYVNGYQYIETGKYILNEDASTIKFDYDNPEVSQNLMSAIYLSYTNDASFKFTLEDKELTLESTDPNNSIIIKLLFTQQ